MSARGSRKYAVMLKTEDGPKQVMVYANTRLVAEHRAIARHNREGGSLMLYVESVTFVPRVVA